MALIYTDTAKVAERMLEIGSKTSQLQSIYDHMKALGITAPTLIDISKLQGNYVNEETLKPLVFRGKTLVVEGIALGPAAFQLSPSLIGSLKLKCSSLKDVQYSFYEIVEQQIVVKDTVEAEITEGYKLHGSAKAAEVIELIEEDVVTAVNAVLDLIAPASHNTPVSYPNYWLIYNPDTMRFSVDRAYIARHVE